MPTAYFYRCPQCGLRFPALEERDRCPRCAARLELRARRSLLLEDPGAVPRFLEPPRAVVADGLRSAWNVGSLFRTADAAGFRHVYLCGITPTPPHEGIAKTALGAEQSVPYSYHPDVVALLGRLRARGWTLWALETEGETRWGPDLLVPRGPLAVVVGNERAGVDPEALALCHRVVRLPMRGRKRSLNVAAAFAVLAMWLAAWQTAGRTPA